MPTSVAVALIMLQQQMVAVGSFRILRACPAARAQCVQIFEYDDDNDDDMN